MIRDYNIEWLEKRIFLPVESFGYTDIADATDASENTSLIAAATGNPELEELSTFGLAVGDVAAAGDMWARFFMTPYDLDITKQIRFRVWWAQTAATATDSVTWIVTYQRVVAESTVLVDPITALSTAIPALDLSTGTANQLQATGFGIINRNTLADTNQFLNLKVEADDIGTFSASEVKFVGLEVRYTPRRTAGPRRNVLGGKRLVVTRPLGVQLVSPGQEGL
jgi:hypothetical protein